ncbi:MAG TPA: glycosyltransferase family 2 protein [Candidatus Bathyarchaeia archaeon]|nr:glycosyltransferase family 2 protein [Candidatus Bathyarchaeia archaeon]
MGLNTDELSSTKISHTIVICIPAFNEGKTIGPLVSRSKAYGTHVVVCDDGSTDDTSLEAENSGAIVAIHKKNQGKGAALKTLLHEVSRFHPEIVVTLDGDGQHDPADIPILLSPLLDGEADVVIGCRFGGTNQIPFYRRVGNSLLSFLTNMSAGTRIRDTQSGFRAYSSKAVQGISIIENGMGVDSEILIELAEKGFRIEERNVTVTYDGDTSTLNPASHIIRVIWSIAVAKYRGLRIASILGWAACLGTIATTFVLLGLVRLPVSWFGFGASTLVFTAGAFAIILGPRVKLNRWMRKSKAAPL